jgi:hypothetical protein
MFCADLTLIQFGQIIFEGGVQWKESSQIARGHCSFGHDRLSTDNAVFDLIFDFLQTYDIRKVDWGFPYPRSIGKIECRIQQRSRENYALELRALVYRTEET